MTQIYRATINAYNAGAVTIYSSTQPYVSKPSDSPANTFYDGRIQQPANLQRTVFDGANTFGASKVAYGELVLVNNDGGLDYLKDYGFDGQTVLLELGEVKQNSGGVATWTTVLSGVLEQPEVGWDKLTFIVRDQQFVLLSKPAQLSKYGGTNAIPLGKDGVIGDLQGKPIPVLYGTAYNMPTPCVNTSHLIYQISSNLINNITAVYDRGATLTAGVAIRLALLDLPSAPLTFTVDTSTDICTTATHSYVTGDPATVTTTTTLPAPLVINTPYYVRVLSSTTFTLHDTAAHASANTNKIDLTTTGTGTQTINNNVTLASHYDWAFDATGSYFRLGSSPAGQVTCDASQGATSANRTVAQILNQMMTAIGIAGGSISSADVTALDLLCSYEVGYWASSETEVTTLEAMDAVANSIGAWYGQDRTGVFRMGRIVAPAGTPAATLTTLELASVDRVASSDPGKGVPAYRVNLDYKKLWAVQASDLAGTVGDARRAELREEYRRIKYEDLSVLTTHLLSPELTFQTLLVASADATTEVARRQALYGVPRDRLEARVALDSSLATTLDLGAVVTVQVNRFGYNAGKKFLVIGVRTDLRGGLLDLTLWG